jgi:prepilin-type N-terminal cleavage/methylation domain-containing protein
MMRARRGNFSRARRGMTLIELTVALSITGLAIGVGYSGFAMLTDRRMEAASRAAETARASAVRRAVQTWLTAARLTIEEDEVLFRAVDGVWRSAAGEVADDDLTFFTSASTPLGDGGTIIRLHVERSDSIAAGQRGLVADLWSPDGTRRLSIVLDTLVATLDVSVLSSVLGDAAWQTSWVSSTILPAGVRVRLGDAQERAALTPLLATPITASLENGR